MPYFTLVPYLVILAGIGLSYLRMLPAMTGWVLSALGVLFGLGLAIITIFAGRSDLWWAAALAVLPSIVAIPMVINDLRYPKINDVATNIEAPPAFVQAALDRGRDMPFPEKNGKIIRNSYPNLRPLILDEPIEQAFQRIESLARLQPGWVITRRDAIAFTLEGEATTSFFRFIDDFVIHVADDKGKTVINMRSKSRDGLVDAGANAKRIQTFFQQLEHAEEYEPKSIDQSKTTIEKAKQQITSLPRPVQNWMLWLNIIFLAGLLFIPSHASARWAIAAYVVCFPVAIPFYLYTKDIAMSGVPHILFWTPLLIYLPVKAVEDPRFGPMSLYGVWTALLLLSIAISVTFDVRAVLKYISSKA